MLDSRQNNFDLIRLLAATQVVIGHSLIHLDARGVELVDSLWLPLSFFPGVPIFFTVSGFLVYASYERSCDRPRQYFANRFLRIYPGLWACTFVAVLLLLLFGAVSASDFSRTPFLTWLVGQLTFFPFYTPDMLRGWGVGTPNGSLWTIPVELQFYLLVPVIYWLFARFGRMWVLPWAVLFAISVATYSWLNSLSAESMVFKLGGVCVVPYLFNFLFGVALFKLFHFVRPLVAGRVFIWLAVYVGYCGVFHSMLDWYSPWRYWPNGFGMIGHGLLAMLVLSAAFSYKQLSERILRGQDISYGVYIYHALFINSVIELGWKGWSYAPLAVLAASYAAAFVSWVAVERPALMLKSRLAKRAVIAAS